jgi:hypothetical protein
LQNGHFLLVEVDKKFQVNALEFKEEQGITMYTIMIDVLQIGKKFCPSMCGLSKSSFNMLSP